MFGPSEGVQAPSEPRLKPLPAHPMTTCSGASNWIQDHAQQPLDVVARGTQYGMQAVTDLALALLRWQRCMR